MAKKKTFLWLLTFLLAVGFFCSLAFIFVYFYAPVYIEKEVIPQLAKEAGLKLDANIREIGFSHTDLGEISLGRPDDPAVSVQSVQMNYSFISLLRRRHIRRIVLSGVKIRCGVNERNEFFVPGLDIAALLEKHSKEGSDSGVEETSASSSAPVSVGALLLRNASLDFSYHGRRFRIPVEFKIVPRNGDLSYLEVSAEFYFRGQKVNIFSELDLKLGDARIRLDSDSFDLSRLGDFIPADANITIAGNMDIDTEARIAFSPFRLNALDLSVQLKDFNLSGDGFCLRNVRSANNISQPFIIKLNGLGEKMRFSTSLLSLTDPVPLELSCPSASLDLPSNFSELKAKGDLILESASLPSASSQAALKFVKKFTFPMHFRSELNLNASSWEFDCLAPDDSGSAGLSMKFASSALSCILQPSWRINGAGGGKAKEAFLNCRFPVSEILFKDANSGARISSMLLSGSLKLPSSVKGQSVLRSEFTSKALGIELCSGGDRISFPEFSLAFEAASKKTDPVSTQAMLNFNVPELDTGKHGFRISGLNGVVPLAWPCPLRGAKGEILISSTSWDNIDLGAVNISISQEPSGFFVDAENRSPLVEGMVPELKSKLRIFEDKPPAGTSASLFPEFREDISVTGSLALPYFSIVKPLDMGRFSPDLKGYRLTGGLEADMNFTYASSTGFSASASAALNDMNIENDAEQFSVKGLNAKFSIPSLLPLRSAPAQKIVFAELAKGKISVTGGNIQFQLEGPDKLFVEECSFGWCGGNVYSHALRIVPGKNDYSLVLFCDGVNFAQVLEQLGAAKAGGSGTLNGRIPIKFKAGNISFDKGFLYSTPGESGIIKLSGTEILTAGIPQDTPQFSQIELTRAALKDFVYQWAKLRISTEKGVMVLNLELDGKPSKPLPFSYDSGTGKYNRIEVEGEGIFRPMVIKVNFRIPLNEILYYGKGIKGIFEKLKQ